jgi:hypothetical protein
VVKPTGRPFWQAASPSPSAAHNPPSFVMTVVRESGLWSLANAFLSPVRPDERTDLIARSIDELDSHWGALARMYGDKSIARVSFASLDGRDLAALGKPLANVGEVIARTLDAAKLSA